MHESGYLPHLHEDVTHMSYVITEHSSGSGTDKYCWLQSILRVLFILARSALGSVQSVL